MLPKESATTFTGLWGSRGEQRTAQDMEGIIERVGGVRPGLAFEAEGGGEHQRGSRQCVRRWCPHFLG